VKVQIQRLRHASGHIATGYQGIGSNGLNAVLLDRRPLSIVECAILAVLGTFGRLSALDFFVSRRPYHDRVRLSVQRFLGRQV